MWLRHRTQLRFTRCKLEGAPSAHPSLSDEHCEEAEREAGKAGRARGAGLALTQSRCGKGGSAPASRAAHGTACVPAAADSGAAHGAAFVPARGPEDPLPEAGATLSELDKLLRDTVRAVHERLPVLFQAQGAHPGLAADDVRLPLHGHPPLQRPVERPGQCPATRRAGTKSRFLSLCRGTACTRRRRTSLG